MEEEDSFIKDGDWKAPYREDMTYWSSLVNDKALAQGHCIFSR